MISIYLIFLQAFLFFLSKRINIAKIDIKKMFEFIDDIVRSSGCVLRQNLSDDVTPENVRENWSKVIDMTSAERFNSLTVRDRNIPVYIYHDNFLACNFYLGCSRKIV